MRTRDWLVCFAFVPLVLGGLLLAHRIPDEFTRKVMQLGAVFLTFWLLWSWIKACEYAALVRMHRKAPKVPVLTEVTVLPPGPAESVNAVHKPDTRPEFETSA